MPNYGDAQYWEERYKNSIGKTFDWLEDYQTLKSIISDLKLPKKTSKIINLGCGNSVFCEDMYDDGYINILNIDISKNVIEIMKKRNLKRPLMKFKQMDVRSLPIESNTFDLAIDKSTIDALLCGKDSFVNVAKMINEVQRILKVGGYYMIISYGSPENRMMHLERDFLNFEVCIYTIKKEDFEEVESEKTHYIYLCKKLKGADELYKNFLSTVDMLHKDEVKEEEMILKKVKLIQSEVLENKGDEGKKEANGNSDSCNNSHVINDKVNVNVNDMV